jgi:hypothetical protein
MRAKEDKGEKVRKVTRTGINKKIDDKIVRNIETYSKSPQLISERIKQLDKEWDIERLLEINMAVISIVGNILAAFVSIYCLILPTILMLFFIQHAFQGWCPPLPLLRRFKIRTRYEIDREKYALKAIRGDFSDLKSSDALIADKAFAAAQRI